MRMYGATHLAGTGGPEVDARPQADSQSILGGPVHEVQIEVILQGWRIQHLHLTPPVSAVYLNKYQSLACSRADQHSKAAPIMS